MSTTTDNRVVQMTFDNAQFERETKVTMNTLDKLKEKLNFTNLAKSFKPLEDMSKIDVSPLANGFEQVGLQIDAMQIAAMTAISRLTNAAINAGERLAKALSFDQIRGGFSKYEKKTEAVQTIMVATGKSINEVNEVLDKLNEYTDETSYSFTEMVGTIGKFTSAGVDLDTAEDMVEGIANWAASAGVSARNAGPAFYNLAQAMSTGALKAQDWKSIELLNMSTRDFKESAIEAALELGVLKKNEQGVAMTSKGTAVAINSFNQSLSDGWINADVLAKTLHKYADTNEEFGKKMYNAAYEAKTFTDAIEAVAEALQTGWSKTFELIFGNYEEAKVLWTELANNLIGIFDESIQKRNDLLLAWNRFGGRFELLDALGSALFAVSLVIEGVKNSFTSVFGEITPLVLFNLTRAFSDFVSRLVMSEETFEKFSTLLRGVFSIISIGTKLFGAFVLAVSKVFGALSPIVDELGLLLVSIAEYAVSLNDFIGRTNLFSSAVESIASRLGRYFGVIVDIIAGAIRAIRSFLDARFKMPKLDGVSEFMSETEATFKPVEALFGVIGSAFNGLYNILSRTGPAILRVVNAVGKAFDTIFGSVANAIRNADFETFLNFLKSGVLAAIITKIYYFIYDLKMKLSGFGGITSNLKYALDELGFMFENFSLQIRTEALVKIATAIGILTLSLLVLSSIDTAGLAKGLTAMAVVFTELITALTLLNKFNSGNKSPFAKLINVSNIVVLNGLATAVLTLSLALKLLSTIPVADLGKALFGVTVAMAELVAATIVLSKFGGKIKSSAFTILLFAAAVDLLTIAVKSLGKIEWNELGRGLIAVGIILAELAAFMYGAKFGSFGMIKATAIIELSVALLILASAVKKFADIPSDQIEDGLKRVGIILTELAGFMIVAGLGKHVMSSAIAVGIMAVALGSLAKTVGFLSDFTWPELIKGLVGFGASLGILAVALTLMDASVAGSFALLIAVGAINALVPALQALGSMPVGEIIKSLLTLAAALAILGGASVLLSGLIVPMLGLGAALFMLGAGLLMASVALTGFIAALGTMSALSGTFVTDMIEMFVNFKIRMMTAILEAAPQLIELVLSALDQLLVSLQSHIPKIVETAMLLILGFLEGISSHIQEVIDAGSTVVINFMNGLAKMKLDLITAGMQMVIDFINGLAEAIRTNIDPFIDAVENLANAAIDAFVKIVTKLIPNVFSAGYDAAKGLVDGIAQGIGGVINAGKELGKSVLDGLAEAVGWSSPWWMTILAGRDGAEGLAQGLEDGTSLAYGAGSDVGDNVISGMEGSLNSGYARILGNFQEFVRRIRNMNGGFIVNDEEEEAWENASKARREAEEAEKKAASLLNDLGGGGGGKGGGGGSKSAKKAAEVHIKSLNEIAKTYKADYKLIESVAKHFEQVATKDFFGPSAAMLENYTKELGQFGKGNIDLWKRPQWINEDGSISTVLSFSTNIDDKEVLLPMVTWVDGVKKMFETEEEAIEHFMKTGEHLGMFETIEEANEYAEKLHKSQEYFYKKGSFEKNTIAAANAVDLFSVKLYEAKDPANKLENQTKLLSEAIALIKGETKTASDAAKELAKSATEGATKEQQIMEVTTKLYEERAKGTRAAMAEYKKSVSSAISSTMGLFDKLDKKTEISAESMLENSHDQLEYYESWDAGLQELINQQENGVYTYGQEFIQYLIDQGVNSKPMIEALLRADEEQVTEILENFERIQSITDGKYKSGDVEMPGFLSSMIERFGEFNEQLAKASSDGEDTVIPAIDELGYKAFETVGKFFNEDSGKGFGIQLDYGLAAGLEAGKETVIAKIREIADEVKETFAEETEINSPSKVFTEFGKYIDYGLANGIVDNKQRPISAVEALADTIYKIGSYINGELDLNPVIRPTLDLSSVTASARGISSIFNKNRSVGILAEEEGAEGNSKGSYTFVQNNYSPKALSRIDIYRQTRNQFAEFREVANGI